MVQKVAVLDADGILDDGDVENSKRCLLNCDRILSMDYLVSFCAILFDR